MLDTAVAKRTNATPDAASIQSAFVSVVFGFAAVIFIYVVTVYFIFSELRIGMIAGAGTGVCSIALGFWAKNSDDIVWPARVFLAVTMICATFVASVNGGVDGHIAPFLIVVPLIAGYFLGARSSLVSGALTVLCVIGLYIADVRGLVTETPFEPVFIRTASIVVVVVCIALALITSSLFAGRLSRHASRIEQSRALLASMADVAAVGGWELDIKSKEVIWTDQTRVIHEVGEHYVPTLETAIDFYAPAARPKIEKVVQECIDHGLPFDLELPLITAKGRNIWVRAAGRRIDEAGAPVKLIGAFQDITDRTEYEKELKKKRIEAESASIAKSQFLATMSHEIRTPMNGVMGMLEIILRGDLSDEQKRHAEVAQESADTLLRIINDVLDFSKLEAGQVDLESIPFSPSDLIDHAVSLVAQRAREKGLRLTFEIDKNMPPSLAGDPTRITQVLLNLIGNAVKFTNHGDVVVRADYRSGANGSQLTISVDDTGIGITKEDQAKLFGRFIQADSSTTRRFGGTGLGLAISKQLIELMGGDISVTSMPGAGSTFSFTLPAEPAAPLETAATDAPGNAAPQPAIRALNILVVEDNTVNQMIVEKFLCADGHTVHIVNNGLEAVAAVQSRAFDLVLMDIQMPVMDGVAATRAIRALPGAAKALPIIALTADAMEADREKYLACGMNEYLSKPVQSAALLDAINRVIASGESENAETPAVCGDARSA